MPPDALLLPFDPEISGLVIVDGVVLRAKSGKVLANLIDNLIPKWLKSFGVQLHALFEFVLGDYEKEVVDGHGD